tara:strand:+ start:121 stop:324 length:204 start_codon:yes stop_codon:yes gene_type:complete
MDNVIDMIATDASSSEVSDKLKELLYAKAAERIEAAKPIVANTMFNEPEQGEVEDEVEQEPQEDQGE